MAQVGVQVDEGQKYEISLQDPGVGKGKILGFKFELIVKEKVEIDEAGSVFPDDFFAEGLFHQLQLVQQLERRQARGDSCRGVDEGRLVGKAIGFRAVKPGGRDDLGKFRYQIQSTLEGFLGGPQIRPKAKVGVSVQLRL